MVGNKEISDSWDKKIGYNCRLLNFLYNDKKQADNRKQN